jgi:HEAT repeat protein
MVTELLLRLMNDSDDSVRCAATDSISRANHNNRRTRARLWMALDDQDDCVQQVAVLGLARFGERNILPWLEAKLRSGDVAPHHIYAAATLGDTTLLPAVIFGEERLTQTMKGRQRFEHKDEVQKTVDSLKRAKDASLT